MKKYKIYILLSALFFLASCSTIDKHNKHIDKEIAPELIKKDIDFVQKKLYKHQPNLDWYLSKDSLDLLFTLLKNQTTQPQRPNDLFLKLAPVISSIKQGHTRLNPLSKRLEKTETKRLKSKGYGPLSQFETVFYKDSLYILNNKSPVSAIKVGTQILKVNDLCPTALYHKYVKTVSSDGYNTTYYRHWFNRSFANYYTIEQGVKDTIQFTLKYKDSIFNFTTYRLEKTKKKATANDSIKLKKANPKILKDLNQKKKIYGWTNNKLAKELKISEKDSTVAILHVRSFSQGKHRKAYAQIFDTIKQKNIQHLILDLRNNPGGKLVDMSNLYSYLTNEQHKLTKKAVVTSKSSTIAPMFNHSPIWLYPLTAVGFPLFASYQYLNTTKNEKGQLTYSLSTNKLSKPKPNAFTGKIYVLINGGSFSASSIISAKLQTDKRALFFGEETGGAYNGTVAGLNLTYKLPYSKLDLRLWIMDIRMLDETGAHGRGIMPDYPIKLSLDDLISIEDMEINVVMRYIEKRE